METIEILAKLVQKAKTYYLAYGNSVMAVPVSELTDEMVKLSNKIAKDALKQSKALTKDSER
jgi:hypothetical protein